MAALPTAQTAIVNPSPVSVSSKPNEVLPVVLKHRARARPAALKLAARRRAEMLAAKRAELRNAAAVLSWQSPTAMLMRSPADDVLRSLPQLNLSANELKLFLPNAP
jgi:hypothetical protein